MRTILIVDDDRIMRELVAEQLRGADFSTVAVGSAAEALALVAARKFSAIVSDLQMPERDGFELLDAVQREGRDVPVILMTACASTGTVRRALKAGACGFLTKPFSASELLEIVRKVVI